MEREGTPYLREPEIGLHQAGQVEGKSISRTRKVVGDTHQPIGIVLDEMKGIEEQIIAGHRAALKQERYPADLIFYSKQGKEMTYLLRLGQGRQ